MRCAGYSNGTINKRVIYSLIHAAKTCGLDGLTPAEMDGLIALAEKLEADLLMSGTINPDRRYKLKELKPLGFERGRLYKAHKNLIRKDGRKSYVLGRDLLALNEDAPTLATSSAPMPPVMRRPRGRPRKEMVASARTTATEEVGGYPPCTRKGTPIESQPYQTRNKTAGSSSAHSPEPA